MEALGVVAEAGSDGPLSHGSRDPNSESPAHDDHGARANAGGME